MRKHEVWNVTRLPALSLENLMFGSDEKLHARRAKKRSLGSSYFDHVDLNRDVGNTLLYMLYYGSSVPARRMEND